MLELKHINVSFRTERQDRIFGHTRQQVLFDVSMTVRDGTCLGILGESGSGKSTMGRVLCGLLKPDSGEAVLDGVPIYGSRAGRRNLQNKLSVVFQDYTTSANPRFRVRDIIGEGLTVQERREGSRLDRNWEVADLLETVGLPAAFSDRFPHELSGGQLQRVCIARAVACNPKIILFDEAISSLDAHTQVQIMDLMPELKEWLGLTYIFITHDLTAISPTCVTTCCSSIRAASPSICRCHALARRRTTMHAACCRRSLFLRMRRLTDDHSGHANRSGTEDPDLGAGAGQCAV